MAGFLLGWRSHSEVRRGVQFRLLRVGRRTRVNAAFEGHVPDAKTLEAGFGQPPPLEAGEFRRERHVTLRQGSQPLRLLPVAAARGFRTGVRKGLGVPYPRSPFQRLHSHLKQSSVGGQPRNSDSSTGSNSGS